MAINFIDKSQTNSVPEEEYFLGEHNWNPEQGPIYTINQIIKSA